MGLAAEILDSLEAAHLTVKLAGDGLKVTPASYLTDPLRQLIRANKTALVDLLRQAANEADGLAAMEAFEERAAILEFDAGLSRAEAEAKAGTPISPTDRHGWPHSNASNTREVDTFTARVARFEAFGMSIEQAEALADRMATRDRVGWPTDTSCIECKHCTPGPYCQSPINAGIGPYGQAVNVADRCQSLQYCPAYVEARA